MEYFSLQKPVLLTFSYAKQAQSYLWTGITFTESGDIAKPLGLMNLTTGKLRLSLSQTTMLGSPFRQ